MSNWVKMCIRDRAGSLNIKVNYLLVNGTVAEAAVAKTITVTFKYVAPSTTLGLSLIHIYKLKSKTFA